MEVISYLIQTAEQVPSNEDWLSERERKVLAGFRYPKRRNDWLLGRWTAKQAVSRFQDTPLSSIDIRAAQDGAPEPYFGNEPAQFSISLSHSRNRSLCAVARRSVATGCDLEWVEPREAGFAGDYFTPEEISFVLRTPLEEALAVNLIWSAKESCLKALRKGLSLDTRSVVINPDVGKDETSWNPWTGRCVDSLSSFYGWWRTADGYVYAICSDAPVSVAELSL